MKEQTGYEEKESINQTKRFHRDQAVGKNEVLEISSVDFRLENNLSKILVAQCRMERAGVSDKSWAGTRCQQIRSTP